MHLVTFERRASPEHSMPAAATHDSLRAASLGFESLSIGRPGALRLGAIIATGPHQGDSVDLNRALAVKLAIDDAGAPEAEADSRIPTDMLRFLQGGERALDAARSTLDWVQHSLERYDSPDLLSAGVVVDRADALHRAPVPRPGKLLGVACNYQAHASERGQIEAPVEPVLFLKACTALTGPGDEIVLPRASQAVDYEGELAVVIGRSARHVPASEALQYVAGYTAANDVSARDFQNTRGQHFIGKSCDTFAPLGPVLVTADEIEDPQELDLRTVLSGEIRQKARTSEMIFPVCDVIAFASRLMTLEPGDVLLTGTPAGVGAAADPPRWLRDGDVVDVEIDVIGRLRNYVRSESVSR